MTRPTFEEHVQAALDSLPSELAQALENVAVVVEDEHPDDPDLFGLYEGVPLPERSSADSGHLPDRISVYRVPLEETFSDPAELEREIPAFLFLGIYFVFQAWQANFQLRHPPEGGGVAVFAHLGGIAFGLIAVKLFQARRPLRPRY